MINKLLSMLGIGKSKTTEKTKTAAKKAAPKKAKIESTRIGELGEHEPHMLKL